MVNFDKFEKRVKETYGKQEFPFDEQNWEKAAKMIDASRQGKNRGGSAFGFPDFDTGSAIKKPPERSSAEFRDPESCFSFLGSAIR